VNTSETVYACPYQNICTHVKP